jgi:hypothetical protein
MHGFILSRALIRLITHPLRPRAETHQCGESTTSHFDLARMGAIVKFSMVHRNLNEQPFHSFLTLDRHPELEFSTCAIHRVEATR